ncbi:MAG: hypothetical protein RLP12_01165 [Ekhidna sp.]
MKIFYHTISDTQFEELVTEFCRELLGESVQGFVTGKDGGRDARFAGRARRWPNESFPWDGAVIIQAKHTEKINKSFSDSDFFGDGQSSIISIEINKIKKLFDNDELDFYMLFSNRSLTAIADAKIRAKIASETGIDKDRIRLFDRSELDRLSKRYPECITRADINPVKSPIDIDPQSLADVIVTLADYKNDLSDLMEGSEPPPERRKSLEETNKQNGMRAQYFKKQIRSRMLNFKEIRQFLSDIPNNQPYVKLYEETAKEFEAKLEAWSDPEIPFEKGIEVLVSKLFERDYDLRQNKELTRTVIYYMYCNCDIGNEANDSTEQAFTS